MSRWPAALFFVLASLALVLSLLAWKNVAAPDAEAWWRNAWRVFARGPMARREVFTVRGWRYRNGALISAAFAALTLLFL